jgi:hypothetical protein
MARTHLVVTIALWIVAEAIAMPPEPIEWLTDPDVGYAEAKKAELPILLYLDAHPADEEASDEAQETALAHPLVARVARGRFVAIRLRHASITQTLMQQMQVTDAEPFGIVAATPNGTWVGTIPPDEVAQPITLARELRRILASYGGKLYSEELKPVLEDKSAQPAAIKKALDEIAKFSVAAADEAVINLLDRKELDPALKPRVYRTLAELSTKRSVETLLDAASRDEAAAEALQKCTPAAVEPLLAALNAAKPKQLIAAYDAIVQICAIENGKPADFWDKSSEESRAKEIQRVSQAAAACARQWEGEKSTDTP